MAIETYYFFLSIAVVLGASLYLVNLVYLRYKHRTLYGQSYKAGTPEHARMRAFASKKNITIAIVIWLIFFANLIHDILRLLALDDQHYAHGILVYAPVSSILFFLLMFVLTRNKFNAS